MIGEIVRARVNAAWNKWKEVSRVFKGALQRKKNAKNQRLLWKWVGGFRCHLDFLCGKSSQNSPKPVLIFWSSIPGVFCLYVHC